MGIDNPHDKRFKEFFSNKKSFLSLLKDCVKKLWVDQIDEKDLIKTNILHITGITKLRRLPYAIQITSII